MGPALWTAQALGLSPEGVVTAVVGLSGDPQLTAAVSGMLDFLDAILPIEAGFEGPLPGDVYDSVNGLNYSLTDTADWLTGPSKGSGLADFITRPLTPTQRLAATQTVFNTLVDGVEADALTPAKWRTKFPGADFSTHTRTDNRNRLAGHAGFTRRYSEESGIGR